jgi:biotin transport system substrate-specific component
MIYSASPARKLAAVVLGAVLLALSSYLAIPMVPVPITLQTLAVTLIGALYGWRLGALTIIVWLVAGALGLPVLSDGSSGIQKFMGATAGYLFAFPLAGALTGWLVADRGWNGSRFMLAFLAMLAGTALCLLFGATWLAFNIGVEKALVHGVLPFIVGGILKSLAGAIVLKVIGARAGRSAALA